MGLRQLHERRRERQIADRDLKRIAADGPDDAHVGTPAQRADTVGGAADQEAAGSLTEEGNEWIAVAGRLKAHVRSHAPREAALGDGRGEAPLGDVVSAGEPADAHGAADRELRGVNRPDVDARQPVRQLVAAQLGQLARGQRWGERADERNCVARAGEADPPGAARVRHAADHADHRCRVDRAARLGGWALVVQRHIPAHDRGLQRAAGIAQAADRLRQLPGDVSLLGVAEVEVVRRPQRLRADAREVRRALQHRLDRARVRVGGDAAAVAVDAHRQRGDRPVLAGWVGIEIAVERQHRGVGLPGAAHRARLHDRVVLFEQRPARRYVRGRQQRQQRLAGGGVGGQRRRGWRVDRLCRLHRLKVVQRTVVDERCDRHVPDELAAVENPHPMRVRHDADRRTVDLPLLAQRHHRLHVLRLDHTQHPLLGLAHHHLERLHPRLAQWNLRDVEVDPHLALRGHLRGRGGQARCAQVLQRHDQPPLQQLERALQQLLLLERIAHLHGRALVRVRVAQLGRGEHRGTADPVAAGARAEQHKRVAGAGGRAAHQFLALCQAEGHRVDEAVLLVRPLEIHLPADGRHADRVAVVADA